MNRDREGGWEGREGREEGQIEGEERGQKRREGERCRKQGRGEEREKRWKKKAGVVKAVRRVNRRRGNRGFEKVQGSKGQRTGELCGRPFR